MKNVSLNGSVMIVGGIIIMFIDIRIVEIIRLMIRNGSVIRKLILKVCWILLSMKVGISMDSWLGVVFGLGVILVRLVSILGLVWVFMKL